MRAKSDCIRAAGRAARQQGEQEGRCVSGGNESQHTVPKTSIDQKVSERHSSRHPSTDSGIDDSAGSRQDEHEHTRTNSDGPAGPTRPSIDTGDRNPLSWLTASCSLRVPVHSRPSQSSVGLKQLLAAGVDPCVQPRIDFRAWTVTHPRVRLYTGQPGSVGPTAGFDFPIASIVNEGTIGGAIHREEPLLRLTPFSFSAKRRACRQ